MCPSAIGENVHEPQQKKISKVDRAIQTVSVGANILG